MNKFINLLYILPLSIICSCSNGGAKRSDYYKTFTVEYKVDESNNTIEKEFEINISNFKIFQKDTSNTISYNNLIGGDKITIYYKNSNYDNIISIEAELLNTLDNVEVEFTPAYPMTAPLELLKEGYTINPENITYAINKDNSITELSKIKMNNNYFISYNYINENSVTGLIAANLYSYNPRT